jgi:D-glycero-alpha-D-manno-heptose-7-phosphate kinase
MIISRTPVRITLFGGGTDYKSYFHKNGGITLGFAINKYSYLILNENKDSIYNHNFFLAYRKIEKVRKINQIKHLSIKSCLKFCKINKKAQIHYLSDIPSATGLGSSSSFTVGLLKVLYCLKKKEISNFSLAKKSIFIEQNLNKEVVGCQDQITCSVGGILKIEYKKNNQIKYKNIHLTKKRKKDLFNRLMLFYTGKTRISGLTLKNQETKTIKGNNSYALNKMKEICIKAIDILENPKIKIDKLGNLFHQNWELKKTLSNKVSNKKINYYYQLAINNGALGGKLVGAGNGGFLLFFVKSKSKKKLRKVLNNLQEVRFDIDYQGSKIIYK